MNLNKGVMQIANLVIINHEIHEIIHIHKELKISLGICHRIMKDGKCRNPTESFSSIGRVAFRIHRQFQVFKNSP